MSSRGLEQGPMDIDKAERSPMRPISLNAEQQEVVFDAIRDALSDFTRAEARGLLQSRGIKYADVLRCVARSIATNLDLSKKVSEGDWLYMGIGDFISERRLAQYSDPDSKISDTNFAFRANLIIQKQQKANGEQQHS